MLLAIQTAPLFGSILAVLFSLAFSSLLSVISYTALMLLTAVAAVKVYAFVMVKMGKVDASFDPLAVVCIIYDLLQSCFLTNLPRLPACRCLCPSLPSRNMPPALLR